MNARMCLLLIVMVSLNAASIANPLSDRIKQAEAFANSDAKKGEALARTLIKEAVAAGDVNAEVDAHRVLGFNLAIQKQSREALASYEHALKLNDVVVEPLREAILLRHRGVTHYDLNEHDLALGFYFEALNIFERENNPLEAGKTRANIGNVYNLQGFSVKAIEQQRLALALFERADFKLGVAGTSLNLGSALTEHTDNEKWTEAQIEANFVEAEQHWRRALAAFEQLKIDRGVAKSLNSLWRAAQRRQAHEEALAFAERSLLIAEKVGDVEEQTISLRHLAESLSATDQHGQAMAMVRRSITLSRAPDLTDSLRNSFSVGERVAEKAGELRDALEWLREKARIDAKRYESGIDDRVAEINARYEDERRDRELLELRQAKEVANLRAARDRIVRISLLSVSILIALLALLLWRLLRLREKKRVALELAAATDPLTNAYNRRGFFDLANQRAQLANGVILIDIDNFKLINDRHGHDCGDEVLRQVAERIRASLRADDILARWGGEEFLVAHQLVHAEEAENHADAIRAAVADGAMRCGAQSIAATVSVGVVPATAAHWPDLIRGADQAMFEAKRNGKNQVIVGAAA